MLIFNCSRFRRPRSVVQEVMASILARLVVLCSYCTSGKKGFEITAKHVCSSNYLSQDRIRPDMLVTSRRSSKRFKRRMEYINGVRTIAPTHKDK